MMLFTEEKNIFLKALNVILILWLIGAIVFCYGNVINLVMPEPIRTHDEYKATDCRYFQKEEENNQEEYCESQYENYKQMANRNTYYNKRNLLIASGNVVIVGGVLILLNKKKQK
ncbi:MAG: hypothetical protein PHS45_00055 [Bacilli bacterium]|nr:hypothetical protein [Bacilli bacterium]